MKYRILVSILVAVFFLSGCVAGAVAMDKTDKDKSHVINKPMFESGAPERCKGRQWKNPDERLECQFPSPPLGRWKAVYTRNFASAHDLPPENISADFSSGVEYMEIEVLPFGKNGEARACLANMLIKKPHDVALYGEGLYPPPLPHERKLAHYINLEKYKNTLKPISSIETASRDYISNKSGFRQSTVAVYAEEVLSGFDYISANFNCRNISMNPQYFPGEYAFWVEKASVWGRYKNQYRNMDTPGRPKGNRAFDHSHLFINVPHELVSTIFDGIHIGGQ